jgi:hypothetical protein
MTKRPDTTEGYVYYARFNTNKGKFYKIGFTKMKTIEKRFSYNGSENYKLIDEVFMYKYSLYAYEIEHMFHSVLSWEQTYGYHSIRKYFLDLSKHPLFGDGQTELYKEDVLGLDPQYKRPLNLINLFRSSKPSFKQIRRPNMVWQVNPKTGKGLVGDYSGGEIAKKEFRVMDEFLVQPLFETEAEYRKKHGDWVVSLQKWAIRNAFDGGVFGEEETVHGVDSLPQNISKLINLKRFETVWAYTKTIPKEICYLPNLEVISFRNSNIEHIPMELYSIKKLRELDLGYTDVECFSSDIASLTSLEILNIESCQKVNSLPVELEALPSLKEIKISKNKYPLLKKWLPNKNHLLTWDDNDWMYDEENASSIDGYEEVC